MDKHMLKFLAARMCDEPVCDGDLDCQFATGTGCRLPTEDQIAQYALDLLEERAQTRAALEQIAQAMVCISLEPDVTVEENAAYLSKCLSIKEQIARKALAQYSRPEDLDIPAPDPYTHQTGK